MIGHSMQGTMDEYRMKELLTTQKAPPFMQITGALCGNRRNNT
jgi:hypothetical protein